MRVLVGCEYSGRVRNAFREAGHDAWSCDLLPSEDDSPFHIHGDVLPLLGQGWDLGIFHPPCTYLAVSGLHWNKRDPARAAKTEEALDFVRTLMSAPIERIAVENPVSCISSRIRKPCPTPCSRWSWKTATACWRIFPERCVSSIFVFCRGTRLRLSFRLMT